MLRDVSEIYDGAGDVEKNCFRRRSKNSTSIHSYTICPL